MWDSIKICGKTAPSMSHFNKICGRTLPSMSRPFSPTIYTAIKYGSRTIWGFEAQNVEG